MLKKILPGIIVGIFAALFIAAFALKDTMNSTISDMMRQQSSPMVNSTGEALVDSLYNYSAHGSAYEITFLEFGSKGCSACKRMEAVMEDISREYPEKVNVVFLNVLEPESQTFMKYYGIAAIPTQVFLNKEGKEFFRHTGFLSKVEIDHHIASKN